VRRATAVTGRAAPRGGRPGPARFSCPSGRRRLSVKAGLRVYLCQAAGRSAVAPRSRGVLRLLVVLCPGFGRGPAAEPVHQPAGVVPVHPRGGNALHVGEAAQRAGAERGVLADALGLVQTGGRLRQSVVQGIPDRAPVIISGGRDGTVRVWRTADRTPLVPPLDLPESVWAVAVHGNVIITAAGTDIAVNQPTLPRPMR
jgi:hypothetical protein